MGTLQRLCDVDADACQPQMKLPLEVVRDSTAWNLSHATLCYRQAALRFTDGSLHFMPSS